MNAVRVGAEQSLLLGFATATHRHVLIGLLCWIIYRSRLPGRGLIEYVAMFPQAVPRLVFAFGMMWAWLVFPLPIYGTIWILLIAYLTVFLPLGVRTISGVMLQLDKSLEECGADVRRAVGLSDAHHHHAAAATRAAGRLAAAVHRQRARTRRLDPADGAAKQGDHAGHRGGAGSPLSAELTAAMALIQTVVVGIAMVIFWRSPAGCRRRRVHDRAHAAIEVERSGLDPLRHTSPPCSDVSFQVQARRTTHPARPVRLRQDHDAARASPGWSGQARAPSASAAR